MMKKTTFIVRTAVIVAAPVTRRVRHDAYAAQCRYRRSRRRRARLLVTGGPLGTVAGAAAGGIVGANVR